MDSLPSETVNVFILLTLPARARCGLGRVCRLWAFLVLTDTTTWPPLCADMLLRLQRGEQDEWQWSLIYECKEAAVQAREDLMWLCLAVAHDPIDVQIGQYSEEVIIQRELYRCASFAARYGHDSFVWAFANKCHFRAYAAVGAARSGRCELMEALLAETRCSAPRGEHAACELLETQVFLAAAKGGHSALLERLCALLPGKGHASVIIEGAASGGHADLVRLALSIEKEQDLSDAVTVATRKGHSKVLDLLSGDGRVDTPTIAELAAMYGRYGIIRWCAQREPNLDYYRLLHHALAAADADEDYPPHKQKRQRRCYAELVYMLSIEHGVVLFNGGVPRISNSGILINEGQALLASELYVEWAGSRVERG